MRSERSYDAQRSAVEASYQRMRALETRPHTPAQARHAAAELSAALRAAKAAAGASAHGRWTRELAELDRVQVWLRWARLNDLGVTLPTTIRVGNYAATGPHIAGMGGGTADLAELPEPRIGIDLRAVVDATS